MSSPDHVALPSDVRVVKLDDDAILARHGELTARDHLIGLEATVARLERELVTARKRVRRLRDTVDERSAELDAMRASRTWRVGRLVTAPGRRLRG